jgi:hypothetical protein
MTCVWWGGGFSEEEGVEGLRNSGDASVVVLQCPPCLLLSSLPSVV